MKLSKSQLISIYNIVVVIVINLIAYKYLHRGLLLVILLLTISSIVGVVYQAVNERKRTTAAINEVTYYVEKHGQDIFTNMPIGIIAINSSGIIRWINPYISEIFEREIEMSSIDEFFPNILKELADSDSTNVEMNGKTYQVIFRDGALYFFDNTEFNDVVLKYNRERIVLGYINLDNYEDYHNSLDDQRASDVVLHMSKIISTWCSENQIYLKKYSSSKYLIVMNEESLKKVSAHKFSVLDEIREYGIHQKLPLTLSIGIAHNYDSIVKLGEVAIDGLDLVLNRGGDQVVVKSRDGKNEFYGGKTDAVEKRNRVKVRMFSESVANLIRNSKDVFVMGHIDPDFDSIGACAGISRLAASFDKEVSVVMNIESMNASSKKLINEMKDSFFYSCIKKESEVVDLISKHSLVIVVDTHKQSMVESKYILDQARNVIVIDHHRRGDEFIENPILSFVEPYASSTSELVTELIDFQKSRVEVSPIEATALLAGIIVDTKHFVYRTGNRTFAAAALLKSFGADTIVIQDLLKEELHKVVIKNEMISRITMVADNCAVTYMTSDSVVPGELLAQTADEIMEIENVRAAFVVGMIKPNVAALSARSLGEVNVQLFAEQLGGGGHMTAAATQIEGISISDMVSDLKHLLNGGSENESDFS